MWPESRRFLLRVLLKRLVCTALAAATICSMQAAPAFAAQSGTVIPSPAYAQASSAGAALLQHFKNMDTSFDMSTYSLTEQQFSDLYDQMIFENPILFYTNGCTYTSVNGLVTKVEPKYATSKAQVTAQTAEIERAVTGALSSVNTSMTPLEKAVQVHNYLALTIDYDNAGVAANNVPSSSYNVYGAMVKHVAVCQGYALAYKMILDRLGIPCVTVQSDSMNHMWNAVQLDGNWYHLDVTWDDSTGTFGTYTTNMLLVSDFKASSAQNAHKDWYGMPQPAYSTSLDTTDWKTAISNLQAKYHLDTALVTDTASYTLSAGSSYVFKAKANPGQILIAKADDSSLADVTFFYAQADGSYLFKITGKKAGQTTVRTFAESGKETSFPLTVKPAANFVSDTTSLVSLKPGQTYYFKLTWKAGGAPAFPNVSTGNSAFQVSLAKKQGNSAIYMVKTASNAVSGTQTGVYAIPANGTPAVQFYVKVA